MHGRALVVGGGIAGLAAARGLLRAGWEVEVRERRGSPPDIGGALGLWHGSMAALDRLGLGERIRERAERPSRGVLADPSGRALVSVGRRGTNACLISRSSLLAVLLDGLPDGLVRWRTPVTEADVRGAGAFDAVVGADGIHSLVRRTAFPWAAVPRPLGTVAYRGTAPGPVGVASETWGRGRLFGVTPMDARTTNWFASLRTELLRGREDRDHVDLLRELYGGWHPVVTRVLDALPGTGVDRRELHDLPALASYVHGRHVLIGDAAHAMAPNLGRGACESLVDAAALADALGAEPAVGGALARYDRRRHGPTRRIVDASRALNRVSTAVRLHGPRNRAMGVLGHLL
ncbi:FAD-dependent monooxygenase [Nocardiopsis quinghaiensis]|uniref:FAD-dependent monooxygenase n=1 Tax=Nocardiopsis quinghaiensis TaxID=464995 RepID=UPI001239115A|nr:FAD-dependent monooxygenase [Nocardiopsis quinghaiensis]